MKTKGSYETSNACARRTNRRAVTGSLRFAAQWMLTLTLLATVASAPASPPRLDNKSSVATLSANLYIGASTERILALDPTAPGYITNLIGAVTQVYYEIIASQPAVRLQAVADEIVAQQPDLVALQEVTLLRNQSPGDLVIGGNLAATNVVFDYLQILVDALAARGAHYAVAVTAEEWDVEVPMMNLQTGTFDDLRQTDRDVILVRTDRPPGHLRVTHPQSGHFVSAVQIPALGVEVSRGWCAVDVFVRGERIHFVNAHLEIETAPEIQMLQAVELMDRLAQVDLPVILAGDFNADPLYRNGVQTYDAFGAADFADVWTTLNPAAAAGGLTWGHDEWLADPTIPFVWRFDLVLFRGPGLIPTEMEVLDLALDRTAPPLWASDHAAVSATFALRKAPARQPVSHGQKSRHQF